MRRWSRTGVILAAAVCACALGAAGGETPVAPVLDAKSVDLSFTSPEFETPHVAWAKPDARGLTRVAFLLEGASSCREVVELAERFEIEPSASLGCFARPQDDDRSSFMKLDLARVRAKYNELLAPGRIYDAILLSGDTWDQLTADSKSRIRTMVWNGAGLVWIDPATKAPDALEMLPASGRGAKAEPAAWQAEGDHFITRAIPFQALPPARSYEYSEVKGSVIAAAGKAPLLVLGEYGHGRVALLNYAASDHLGTDRQTHALLPRESAYPKIQYPYWEYQYGLIGRSILWAAQKEPVEQIVAAAEGEIGDKPGIALKIEAQAKTGAELAWSFMDPYGRTLAEGSNPVALRKGTTDLVMRLPALARGMNLAHMVLKTPDGASDWRAVALPRDSAAKIADVKLSKESYDRSESVSAEVAVAGDLSAGGMSLEARLVDGRGRILARQEKPITDATPFVFPLSNAISTAGALDVRLKQGEAVLDRRVEKFAVRLPEARDDFECLMRTAGPVSHESLFGARMKVMKEIGVTCIAQEPPEDAAWAAAALDHGLPMVGEQRPGLSPWIGNGAKGPAVTRAIWEALFSGCDVARVGNEQAYIAPDYTLFAGARDIQAAVAQIRGGPGKLLLSCTAAGGKAAVEITDAGGAPWHAGAVCERESGSSRYVGIACGSSEAKQAATVKFGREAYVYDLITGEAFGKASSVKTELGPDVVRLFALMPYETAGLEVQSEKSCARGGVFHAAVRVEAEKEIGVRQQPKLDLHVVRMEVFDPAGREAAPYRANLLCKEGKGEAAIPFALSDAPGKWTLHFRDVATGVRAVKAVELQ